MDTLLLMSAKDNEIQQLRDELQRVQLELHSVNGARASQAQAAAAQPPPPSDGALADALEAQRAAEARAEKAELSVAEQKQGMAKLQAKLNAVSTLYTEAAQREAVLRLQLEQSGSAARPSYE